jgi:hypothetical protein
VLGFELRESVVERVAGVPGADVKTTVTNHQTIGWLASAQLLLRIPNDDADVAKEAIHTPAGR